MSFKQAVVLGIGLCVGEGIVRVAAKVLDKACERYLIPKLEEMTNEKLDSMMKEAEEVISE